ncbi:MAG: LamG-like jellyroll fold domain-containing protein, partial [Pseudomonadota bacterium]
MVTVSENILGSTLRNNLLAITRTQRGLDVATLRLATGLKVNSAIDNPQNFFTAQSLDNRAFDLIRLLDKIDLSTKTIEEAIHGTEALSQLLDQADAVVTTTKEELELGLTFPDLTSVVEEEKTFNPPTLSELITAAAPVAYYRLNETSGTTAFEATGNPNVSDAIYTSGATPGGAPLYLNGASPSAQFDGIDDHIDVPDSVDINLSASPNRTIELVFNADDVTGRQVLYEEGATVNGFAIYLDNDILYLTAEDDNGTNRFADVNINSNDIAGIRIQPGQSYHVSMFFDQANGRIRGFLDGEFLGEELVLSEPFPPHSGDIGIGAANQGVQFHDGESGVNNGFNFAGRISDVAIYDRNLSDIELQQHADALNPTQSLAYVNTDYDNIINQIDDIVEDAKFLGINLLSNDDLTVDFNENRTSSITIEGTDLSRRGLGLQRNDFIELDDVNAILDQIEAAKEEVEEYTRSLTNALNVINIRDDQIREQINILEAGADDLTVADQNEEGANLLALQTRQQIAV